MRDGGCGRTVEAPSRVACNGARITRNLHEAEIAKLDSVTLISRDERYTSQR